MIVKSFQIGGSGCGSVGRAVASNSRGPRFKSRHRKKFIFNILLSNVLKRRNKEKEAGKVHCLKKISN